MQRIRGLLATAVEFGRDILQLNVQTAFISASVEDDKNRSSTGNEASQNLVRSSPESQELANYYQYLRDEDWLRTA